MKTGLEKHTGTGEDFLTIYFNLIPGRVPPGRFLFCNLSKIVKNLLEILHDLKKKNLRLPPGSGCGSLSKWSLIIAETLVRYIIYSYLPVCGSDCGHYSDEKRLRV